MKTRRLALVLALITTGAASAQTTHPGRTDNPHTTSLGNLIDTTLTNTGHFDLLQWDGSAWANSPDLTVSGALSVTGTTSMQGLLNVEGAVTATGDLTVHRASDGEKMFSFDSTTGSLTVSGDLTVSGNLSVAGESVGSGSGSGGLPQAPPRQVPTQNTIVTIDSVDEVGSDLSITIGTDGLPVISYFDQTNRDLKLVHCTSADCSSFDPPVTLDFTDVTGIFTSIAIGSDGYPIVSYSSLSANQLRVLHCTSTDCSTHDPPRDVGNTGNGGFYSSIAIGTDGHPVISFKDEMTEGAALVHCTNQDCSTFDTQVMLEAGSSIGLYSSIAIGVDGFPVISYADQGSGSLDLVHCTNTNCSSFDAPVSIGISGHFSSLTIGSDGFPIVTYTQTLLYAVHCTAVDCSSNDTPVQLVAEQGQEASVTIGDDGLPVVSYFAAGAVDPLKIIRCKTPNCSATDSPLVLASGPPERYRDTAITIGTDGLPVIACFDITANDLRVARCGNPRCLPGFRSSR